MKWESDLRLRPEAPSPTVPAQKTATRKYSRSSRKSENCWRRQVTTQTALLLTHRHRLTVSLLRLVAEA
jgi:hypothetical protein